MNEQKELLDIDVSAIFDEDEISTFVGGDRRKIIFFLKKRTIILFSLYRCKGSQKKGLSTYTIDFIIVGT